MLAQLGRRQQSFLWRNLLTIINSHALYLDTMVNGDRLDPFVISPQVTALKECDT